MTPFARLGRFVHRRRLLVIAAWAVLVLVAVPFAPQVPGVLRAGGFSLDDLESARARHLLEDELGLPSSALAVIYHSDSRRAGTPEWHAATSSVIGAFEGAPHVVRILSHQLAPRQVSADGRTAYDVVLLDLPSDSSPDALPVLEPLLRQPPGLEVALAGGPAFYGDVQRVSEEDLRRSELISLPLAGLTLLLVFGSLVAAAVPLAVGGASVLVALAVIFVLASLTPLSIFVLNLATLLGLGLGVDYSLLLTSRFREELAAGAGGGDRVGRAVEATVATAGRAVFFSGLTVLLGLIGLVLFEFMILRSVGVAGAVVVTLAVLAALTLLPAILSLIGDRIDALAVRRVGAPNDGDGAWARLARRVMNHPLRVLVPTLGLLLILGAPFLHVRFNAPDTTILPPSVPSRASFDLLTREFGEGDFAPLSLAVRTPGPVTDPANIAALHDWSRRLVADERIMRIVSLVDADPRLTAEQYQLLYAAGNGPPDRYLQLRLEATTRGNLTAFTVYTPYGPNHPDARALVEDLRAAARTGTGPLAPPAVATVLVGGGAAEVTDVVSRIGADFPRSALFIIISTYLVLFLLLRSVILPAKALLMNGLSLVASFGALVWIFQDGNLSALLGFQPLGFVETSQPVILFCVLFGLSMDYEVFLLTRMREAWDRTGDNREAVATGLERSGRIVTSAALIVVVVAVSFVFADIVLIKALGLGIAIAVALDATIVRALLVPATMRLLRDWNWWLPARLRRLVGSGISGALRAALPLALVVTVIAGCNTAPILANPPVVRSTAPPTAPAPSPIADPVPLAFPRDDGPHERLTEWWYYTGHLRADEAGGNGRRFGFEFVIFRAERGEFPVSWASHLALTDETGARFLYAQRTEIGRQVDTSPRGVTGEPVAFELTVRGLDPTRPEVAPGAPWSMRGAEGLDKLRADVSPAEATAQGQAVGFGIDLVVSATGSPVLHNGIGWLDFGPAGSSYYYSRTRMDATGTVTLGAETLTVEGIAWFDHQWGDFISVGAGGWDWFAVNLADGTDLTISIVRDRDDRRALAYGTLVRPDGRSEHLRADAFRLESTRTWTSPRTGAVYPAGWRIELPADALVIDLEPTIADQELDTRASTGVIYWEGSQRVRATRNGIALEGEAYVELTGYLPGEAGG
ncbi:MAG: hypothetical protein FJ038_07005 [Chloroflexi bacterium]|nr:hypothetical protein [Chloroflexota bacterium]